MCKNWHTKFWHSWKSSWWPAAPILKERVCCKRLHTRKATQRLTWQRLAFWPAWGGRLDLSVQWSTSAFGVSLIRDVQSKQTVLELRGAGLCFSSSRAIRLALNAQCNGALQPASTDTPLLAEPEARFALSQARLCCRMLCRSRLQELCKSCVHHVPSTAASGLSLALLWGPVRSQWATPLL